MCGIVGYVGHRNAVDIIFQGLKRLEYRGYDSAGVSIVDHNRILMEKAPGKLAKLEPLLKNLPERSTVGIGHTRWATHGAPNKQNAHPHQADEVSIIHNGIIENYRELKTRLIKEGAKFSSETDSEVIAHLLSHELRSSSPEEALQRVLTQLKGAYALGVLIQSTPETIYVAKHGSPMALGLGEHEQFFGSDASAFIGEASKAIFLNDGEWAKLTKDSIECFNFNGQKINPSIEPLNWTRGAIEKQGFRHFMLKEIHEQPAVISETISRLIDYGELEFRTEQMGFENIDFTRVDNIQVVACGTAYLSGVVARYFLEPLLNIPINVELASEFRYRKPFLNKGSLIISISQSGETADTLASVSYAKSKGCQLLSICNTEHSAIPRESHGVFLMNAGPEIGVASTKAFTSQIICLYLWGLALGHKKGSLSNDELGQILDELRALPLHMETAIGAYKDIDQLARKFYESHNFLYLGRGMSFPIALEGALKLKEISYIHAEGYGAGELKHGPIALVDRHMPIVAICPEDHYYEKTMSNIEEVVCREGMVIGIGSPNDTRLQELCTDFIPCPKVNNSVFQAIINSVPVQLLAYSIAVHRGTDVDQPRNLAKSVTVE